MDIGRSAARSHQSRSPERARLRSLPVRRTTDSAPKAEPDCLTASRHSRGTTSTAGDTPATTPIILARQPARNRLPESLPMLLPPHRWTTERPHRKASCTMSSSTLSCSHRNSSLSRCCDDPLNFTQYVSIRYTERLAESGIEPSVGSRGDSYDNALAESIIGLYKTEVIRRRGPRHGLEDIEFAPSSGCIGTTRNDSWSRSEMSPPSSTR